MNAGRPLTVAEIKARVEMIRPVRTRDPQVTIRGAINNVTLAVSLGGRPARYTWWPRHLADSTFRQPLADSDLKAGTLVVNKEVWLAVWPDFHAGPSRSQGEVNLTERAVNWLEQERDVPPDPWASPRPRGDRRRAQSRAQSDEARRAWEGYLFDRGKGRGAEEETGEGFLVYAEKGTGHLSADRQAGGVH